MTTPPDFCKLVNTRHCSLFDSQSPQGYRRFILHLAMAKNNHAQLLYGLSHSFCHAQFPSLYRNEGLRYLSKVFQIFPLLDTHMPRVTSSMDQDTCIHCQWYYLPLNALEILMLSEQSFYTT